MIQFDEHIFQMGWFNHQLVNNNPFVRPYKNHLQSSMVTYLATVVGCHLLKMWFLLKMMEISMLFVENTSRDVPQRPMKHVYIYICIVRAVTR